MYITPSVAFPPFTMKAPDSGSGVLGPHHTVEVSQCSRTTIAPAPYAKRRVRPSIHTYHARLRLVVSRTNRYRAP